MLTTCIAILVQGVTLFTVKRSVPQLRLLRCIKTFEIFYMRVGTSQRCFLIQIDMYLSHVIVKLIMFISFNKKILRKSLRKMEKRNRWKMIFQG